MILDDWRREDAATSMRLRWRDGDMRVYVEAPPGFEGPDGDASPFVAALLLLALARHEDVDVDGLVSARLLRGTQRAQTIYCAWNARLRPAAIRAAGDTPVPARGDAVVSLLSRGVDSLYSAAVERVDEDLSHLIHWQGLEPLHSEATAAAELEECRSIAGLLGLPLLTGSTNLRAALDPHAWYHDSHGGVLAGLAIALGGGARHVVIPGTDSPRSLGPIGSSPALDHHLGTEWVRIEHDFTGAGRVDKVAAIAAQRPDLLPHLKVCFAVDRVGNCGRCGKCLLTMCALASAGALDRATGFPPLDLDAVRALKPSPLRSRHEWSEVLLSLGTTGSQGRLRRAMEVALRRSARRRRSWKAPERGFDWAASTRALRLLRDGRPEARRSFAAARPLPQHVLRGAARARRRGGRLAPVGRPRRAAAPLRGGGPAARRARGRARRAVRRPATSRCSSTPPGSRSTRRCRRRPARSAACSGSSSRSPTRGSRSSTRARGVAGRLRPRERPASHGAEPVGFLLARPGPGTVPLLLADHPVLGDRLLTTRRAEAADLGYSEPVLLGHLVRAAPVTGSLEPPPCDVPWARRFGMSRRIG